MMWGAKKERTEEDILNANSSENFDSENDLRPKIFSDYIGQKKVKDRLMIYAGAAKKRNEPLDHVLLSGPPGLGKTTLAYIISKEMGSNIKVTTGPSIDNGKDLLYILADLKPGDVFFIDEIHRLKRSIAEVLYSAMEDFQIDVILGADNSVKPARLQLNKFTLIGATTRTGLLSSPFRDRFGINEHLEFYSEEDLEEIIIRSAKILDIGISKGGASEIAKRSRGTPRIANKILKRTRDYAEMNDFNTIDNHIAINALEMFEIDDIGLDVMDNKLLLTLIEKFDGNPVGLSTLASCINEEKDTIEDVYEPYLMQIGFLTKTPRGRIATPKAFKHFGIDKNIPLSNVKISNLKF